MVNHCIGVLGATSLVGTALLPYLNDIHEKVAAFSRTSNFDDNKPNTENNIVWHQLKKTTGNKIEVCFTFPPINVYITDDDLDSVKSVSRFTSTH